MKRLDNRVMSYNNADVKGLFPFTPSQGKIFILSDNLVHQQLEILKPEQWRGSLIGEHRHAEPLRADADPGEDNLKLRQVTGQSAERVVGTHTRLESPWKDTRLFPPQAHLLLPWE